MGPREHFVLKEFVWWNFHKKVLLWKSDYVGQNSIMTIFFDQIPIIVLPIRQVLQKNIFGHVFFFGPHI